MGLNILSCGDRVAVVVPNLPVVQKTGQSCVNWYYSVGESITNKLTLGKTDNVQRHA